MYCRNCGAQVGSSKFCEYCGSSQNQDSYENIGRSTDNASSPKYEEEHIEVDKTERKVNKIAFGLLAILLGSLGIHRFYAGRIVSGIVYILFSWTGIPFILGVIEGILALVRPDDEPDGTIYVRDSYFI